jgi:hypothetical protein
VTVYYGVKRQFRRITHSARCAVIPLVASLVNSSAAAQWKFVRTQDAITDEQTIAFMVNSLNTVPNAIGAPARATLVIRCKEGKPSAIYVTTNMYVGDEAKVQYRFDQLEAIEGTWESGAARDALFMGGSPTDLEIMSALIQRSATFIFRWFPPLSDARTARFNVSGLTSLPVAQLNRCGLDAATSAGRVAQITERRAAAAKQLRATDSAANWKARMLDSLQTRDTLLPWASEIGETKYWKNGPKCPRHREAYPANRVFFRTASDAEFTGRWRISTNFYPDC